MADREQRGHRPELYDRLRQYAASDFYPWHMPGHKRRLVEFDNPFSMDITEIDGFDDLHHPEGILKEAMEEAAEIYGSERTYYLVNGSSCGILAAVSASVKPGGKLLMARNCHKSAYHGALLIQAQVAYVYPKTEKEGFYGALQPEDVEEALKEDPDISAVMMVSPGYEGVVSDIRTIADIVHAHGCALLVDEAHGAHFPFGKSCGIPFPVSALENGADVVIQSLHKTLPSLTQTALLHLGKGGSTRVNPGMLELYLRIFQSSSPSYIFMASIDHCIRLMSGEAGKKLMEEYACNLMEARQCLRKHLHVLRLYEPVSPELYTTDHDGKCFYDPSKFVIVLDGSTEPGAGGAEKAGPWLADMLRRCYHLEPEMNTDRYVILMSSPADTKAGFERMVQALTEIDRMLEREMKIQQAESGIRGKEKELPEKENKMSEKINRLPERAPRAVMNSACASAAPSEMVPITDAAGRICHDFIYIYPPGIPLLVPGELIEKQHVDLIQSWQDHGLEVHGISARSENGWENSMLLCVCP